MRRAFGSPSDAARHALLVLVLVLVGCTSTPQASRDRDAEAKRFLPRADAAVIYVYRDDVGASWTDDTVLYVNDRLIGSTLPMAFFRVDVRAGEHLLHGYGYDQGRLSLDTRNGEIYFVSLVALNGTSEFGLVAPETGKRDILRCCVLLENWAPGQRPILY